VGGEYLDGLTIARERIAREAEEKTGFLDLGRLGLSELPGELFQLKHLRRLNLGYSIQHEDGNWHISAPYLGENLVAASLHRLAELGDLRYLSVSSTDLSDLAPFKSFSNLQSLDCSRTQVSDLTAQLPQDAPGRR
jgi:Leucine-rich repeat (LRR) protein